MPIESGIQIHGLPAVIYVHNWELDPGTAGLKLGPYRSFVKYYNIEKTGEKLRCLLSNFNFTSLRDHVKTKGLT